MTPRPPIHPVDALTPLETCKIYYSRVVKLAVRSGLLDSDPNTEIGHFVFSRYFTDGSELDSALRQALQQYAQQYPELVLQRRSRQTVEFVGAVENYLDSSDTEKVRDLIIVGASHHVWPAGTSYTLTYPWDLEGHGQPVRFRPDLSDFMKRRILAILKRAGKLRNPALIF